MKENAAWIFPAKVEALAEVIEKISSFLAPYVEDKPLLREFELVVEEIFINIASYGFDHDQGVVEITCQIVPQERRVHLIFKDEGRPFDPCLHQKKIITGRDGTPLPGGLGIYFVKELVDEMNYSRLINNNLLSIIKAY